MGVGAARMIVDYAIVNCVYPGSGPCLVSANFAPVGTADLGLGLWGQLDLDGNVSEWNVDFSNPYSEPCADCGGMTMASARVVRGSYMAGMVSQLAVDLRGALDPLNRSSSIVGIRCARTP